MKRLSIDLKKEHNNTLNRQKFKYSFSAKIFFWALDVVAGKKDNLPKAKLLEILASIPYRTWEIRHYMKLTRKFRNLEVVNRSMEIINWGRDAQDNEYNHLMVIHEKMKEDCIRDKWYLNPVFTFFVVVFYIFTTRLMALLSQKRAFLFNAEFENHAEHVYAELVKDNPLWEGQKVTNPIVKEYAGVETWADVFRTISLDERDHMNNSFLFCGKPEYMIEYDGMPDVYRKL